jgi:CRP/FNR family transcriptional regulator
MAEVFHLALSGKEQVLEHVQAGESFNLVPVFMDGALNQANVRAIADTQVMFIKKKDFLDLMAQFPELSKSVAEYFAMRLSYMVDMVENLALFSVRQRMAAFLINQADHRSEDDRSRWTQEDMARQLGTVRDVVGRTLRKLEDDGLIRFDRQRIELLDRVALEQLAQGEE